MKVYIKNIDYKIKLLAWLCVCKICKAYKNKISRQMTEKINMYKSKEVK